MFVYIDKYHSVLKLQFQCIVTEFEKARGYQIERKNYIADLLGQPPLSPEVGEETDIQPIDNKYTHNKRSPLAENEDQGRHRDRYNRYNSRYNDRNNDRYNNRRSYDNDNSFWKSRGDNETNWRSRRDSESTSYDFKHDY